MENRKPRVLFTGEFSGLSTGYAVYARETLTRLHALGKYELAELGTYAHPSDQRVAQLVAQIPWKFYYNVPGNEQEQNEFNSNPTSQFGAFGFERACLDFRPDICFSILDPWMNTYPVSSPFRPFYHLSLMATVDSLPLQDVWLEQYQNVDGALAYTEWGLNALREQSCGRIKTIGFAPAGADLNILQPAQDKAGLRQRCGVRQDALIIGMVARNQVRKLYPDLAIAFRAFLNNAPKDLSERAYLYWHTAYPDLGWNIPLLLKENGIAHRTLFTYFCRACGAVFPSLFMDSRGVCKHCGQYAAVLPNSMFGVPPQAMGLVYNLFDVYVQLSVAEGQGLSIAEAGACGVPVMVVDYSGMAEVCRNIKGTPIKVQRFFRDHGTHQWRAMPDLDDFVGKLINVLSLPEPVRCKKGFEARKGVEEHYTYEKTAKVWADHFDSVQLRPQQDTWLSPPRIHQPNLNVPGNLTNEQFVRWGLVNVAGRPDLSVSYVAARMLRDLNQEATPEINGHFLGGDSSWVGSQSRMRPYSREDAVNEFLHLAQQKNTWEMRRAGR